MNKYPLIISAPHACSKIPNEFRDRIALYDYEIWQFSDPFTDKTAKHPLAFSVHVGKTHRALGDLCRNCRIKEAFCDEDFYGRKIWKEGCELTNKEKRDLLKNNWGSFRGDIIRSIKKLKKMGFKKVLFIDHHNTASDHLVGKTKLTIPPILFANLGLKHSGKKDMVSLSMNSEMIHFFKEEVEKNLPLEVAINSVYKGSNIIRWVTNTVNNYIEGIEIYSVLIEYDLNLIHNPITKKNDLEAKKMLRDGLNNAISSLVEKYILD